MHQSHVAAWSQHLSLNAMQASCPFPYVCLADGKVQLLDTSASNNILIKFKDISPGALAAALAAMDAGVLTVGLR